MTAPHVATVLDEAELRQRLAAELGKRGAVLTDLRLLPPAPGGGNSGITCLARARGGDLTERLVVKVAPPGLAPVRNRDVLRQARLLGALWSDGRIPVPEVVVVSAGEPPEVPPFFAASFVDGDAVEPGLEPAGRRPDADLVRRRALALAALLAKLHSLDAGALGLADEPVLTLQDELAKWAQAFESVELEHRAGHDEVRRLLLGTMPGLAPSALCHGDFRLGNVLCSGPDIAAVIDWEIWSLTDPRLDLTWMLWISDPRHPSAVGPVDGMPPAMELMTAYHDAGGRPVDADELRWFRAMTCYKQAATVALLAKHGRRKQDGSAESFQRLTPLMMTQARSILDGRENLT